MLKKPESKLFIDRLILVVAIIEPVLTLPQAITIFRNHNASGVSILTWLGFNFMVLIWLWYALVHKDRIVLLYQGLFFIFNTVVIFGAILYGGHWV